MHDVSPRFESQIDRLLDALSPHVGQRIALLVVPNHWGDAPIVPGSAFASRLRSWGDQGMEMFVHGFFHRDDQRQRRAVDRFRGRVITAGEGEFLALQRDEAKRRVDAGRSLIEDVTGRPVAGFIAPAWLYSPAARAVLGERGLPIAEDHWTVWSPTTGRRLATGPVITWASRSPLRLGSSLLAAAALRRSPMRVMRVGVHPPDCGHRALMKSIDATLRIALRTRRAGRYRELAA